MEKRVNQGYEIVQSIEVGTSEFVLGVSQYHPEQFVTWKCSGKTDYYWGHYTDSLLKATKDRRTEHPGGCRRPEQRPGRFRYDLHRRHRIPVSGPGRQSAHCDFTRL